MSFDLELLRDELSRYGSVIDCNIYHETNLEIKVKNSTGRQATYTRIQNDFILPYFNVIDSRFGGGYYKSAFIIKE